jgi:hypothetical protein
MRTEASADGQIWQAIDADEMVDIDVEPAQWVDAADAAHQSGAIPGSWTRVLAWSDTVEDPTSDNAVHIDEHQTPAPKLTQRYEIEEWLGDDHGLDVDRVTDLVSAADEIACRYPDPDDRDDREAALTVAYRLMVEDPETVVAALRVERERGRLALLGLQQAAHTLVEDGATRWSGIRSEAGFARAAGVDRMTVRDWRGKA